MRKSHLLFAIIAVIVSSVSLSAGTLYVNVKNDPNPGNITVQARSASSTTNLLNVSVAPNQSTGVKTFTVPTGWYVVTVSWSSGVFHNIANGGGSTIASCNPPTGTCALAGWQVVGTGASGSFSVFVP
jgi:hypothetical protein